MSKLDLDAAIELLERKTVSYKDLEGICDLFFTFKRQNASSHRIYMTVFPEELVNIQPAQNGDAKSYQQKQVVKLLRRMQGE